MGRAYRWGRTRPAKPASFTGSAAAITMMAMHFDCRLPIRCERLLGVVVASLLTLTVVGCSGNSAASNAVAMGIGKKVVKKHDKRGDGLLNSSELFDLKSIYYDRDKYDLDGDDEISAEEIAIRIDAWQGQAAAVHAVDVKVTLDGAPLAGATVRVIPEFDLGDGTQANVGLTDADGAVRIDVALEDLSQALKNPDFRGVFGSGFRIEVTHPQRKIPDEYNVDTRPCRGIARDHRRRS